jgi:hypothetical protein
MATHRRPADHPSQSTASTLRRLAHRIVSAAAREAGNAAVSTTIGGVVGWWLSHR